MPDDFELLAIRQKIERLPELDPREKIDAIESWLNHRAMQPKRWRKNPRLDEIRAGFFVHLGELYLDLDDGDRAGNAEKPIAAYDAAVSIYKRTYFRDKLAHALMNLAAIYDQRRLHGHRSENVQSRIVRRRSLHTQDMPFRLKQQIRWKYLPKRS
jgi:hypothetical protein